MDISAVARIQDTLADLLAGGESSAQLSEPNFLESLSPAAIDRFRRHLQLKRLKLVEIAQPASVMAAASGSSFTEIAAQFWRRCPPRRLPFDNAGRYEADSWTSFLGASGIDIGAPWLPDLARYERERYLAVLRVDLLGRPPLKAAAAQAIGGHDHLALSDYASLRSFGFDVVRLHRHFFHEGKTTSPPVSISGSSPRYLSFVCTSPKKGVHVGTVSAGTARLISQLLRGSSVTQALGELGHDPGTRQFARGSEIVGLLFAAGLLRRRSVDPTLK